MQHYDSQEWKKYVSHDIDKELEILMDKHLMDCNFCLQKYINAVEESDNKSAIQITGDFVEKVMAELEKTEIIYKQKPSGIAVMSYYAAAACITLCLTLSGGFDYLTQSISTTAYGITNSSNQVNEAFINGWTERLTNTTSIFINRIEMIKGE